MIQKAIELTVKGKTLRGMYHRPDQEGKYPTVILFHGFTGDKLEPHRIFLKLSRLLAEEGLAVVRFDFSGSGESDGDFADMTFSIEVLEAEEILNFARDLPATDEGRIGLVGLSMGGAVASILAGKNPSLIKALVLWSAAGIDTMVAIYRNKAYQDTLPRNSRGEIDIGGLWLNHDFYEDLRGWDTYAALKGYQRSTLIIHGTEDQTIPPVTAEKYQSALSGRAKLVYVAGADHTYNLHHWEEKVLSETAIFLKNELI